MFFDVHPKLPMRSKSITKDFYINLLKFSEVGDVYDEYLMVKKEDIELHFFLFEDINPKENYGQVYIRTTNVNQLYKDYLGNNIEIHPNGKLSDKPWGQREFSILDPDNNLLTFGQKV